MDAVEQRRIRDAKRQIKEDSRLPEQTGRPRTAVEQRVIDAKRIIAQTGEGLDTLIKEVEKENPSPTSP